MTWRIVVIGGGENAEHDVFVATATAVARALRSSGFDVDELTIDRDVMWRRGADPLGSQATSSLAAALSLIERADVVFPAVHGPSGEDGTLAALCALTHKPMVGQTSREAEEITVTGPGRVRFAYVGNMPRCLGFRHARADRGGRALHGRSRP